MSIIVTKYQPFKIIDHFIQSIDNTGRLISVDWGEKKIGIAISDPLRIFASKKMIVKNMNISRTLGLLNRIIEENEVVGIVLGMPLDYYGEENDFTLKIINFGIKLQKKTNLHIFMQDERFSSSETLEFCNNIRQKKFNDDASASIILQRALDSIQSYYTQSQIK